MPARAHDAAGRPSLLVLPSTGPSSRQEAAAAAESLQQLLADPASAAHSAAAWRRQLLAAHSPAALQSLTADAELALRPRGQGRAGAGSSGRLSASRSMSPLPPLPLPRRLSRPDAGLAGPCNSFCSSWPSASDLASSAALQPAAPADPAWASFCQASLAAGLAVAMAEAVRQVAVGCAERGRLLAQLWNAYTAALAATIQQQAAEVAQLAAANANLLAGG